MCNVQCAMYNDSRLVSYNKTVKYYAPDISKAN